MRHYAILTAVLLATACGAPQQGNDAAPAPAAKAGGYVKRLLALPVGQQRGVMLRAIQDGGGDCQTITEFKPQPMENGRAVWAVRCDAGSRWIVDVGDDGFARASGLPAETQSPSS